MIRVVLAVALATALLGVSLPVAERAERDRNAALATDELQRLADRAERLARHNDPVAPSDDPASVTVVVDPPQPTVTDGGHLVVADDRLVWVPQTGENRTVDSSAPLSVETPLRIADRARLRLAFVRVDGDAVVRIRRARIETRSRGETSRVRRTPLVRIGLPV